MIQAGNIWQPFDPMQKYRSIDKGWLALMLNPIPTTAYSDAWHGDTDVQE
jgi:hypothetical protein